VTALVDLQTQGTFGTDPKCRAEYLFDVNVRLLEPGLGGGWWWTRPEPVT
jgi:hypothetical protein